MPSNKDGSRRNGKQARMPVAPYMAVGLSSVVHGIGSPRVRLQVRIRRSCPVRLGEYQAALGI